MGQTRTVSRRGLLWPTIAAVCAFAVLIGFGWWQVERLAWKQALLADMRAGLTAPPEELLAGQAPAPYTRVTAQGRFMRSPPGFVFASRGGQPGYLVVRPFKLADGRVVLLDTGFVPETQKGATDRQPISEETAQVTGFIVLGETKGQFTPDVDWPNRIFFIRDIVGLPQALGLVEVEPFLIELTEQVSAAPSQTLREPMRVLAAIPNRHLGYALTWFGLAAALAGVYMAFALKTLKTEP